MESEFSTDLGGTIKNLAKAGNPWGANRIERNSWISECDFPVQVIDGELPELVEYRFWLGCAGACEARAKKTTNAIVELVYMARVNFAV